MQYVHHLQRRYNLSSFNLLGHTAPAQAGTLLLLGPFLDYWLTNMRVDAYSYNLVSVVSVLSICILCFMSFVRHGCCCHQYRTRLDLLFFRVAVRIMFMNEIACVHDLHSVINAVVSLVTYS